jgi:hypothetical protein
MEVVMPTGITVPTPPADTKKENEPSGPLSAVSDGKARPRVTTMNPCDAAVRALLEYAAFVLDQEAKYCQQ